MNHDSLIDQAQHTATFAASAEDKRDYDAAIKSMEYFQQFVQGYAEATIERLRRNKTALQVYMETQK